MRRPGSAPLPAGRGGGKAQGRRQKAPPAPGSEALPQQAASSGR